MSRRRLFRLPRPGSADDLDEEIRVHLELRAEELVRDGWSPEAAREEALRRFGPLDAARKDLARSGRARDRRLGWHAFVGGVAADLSLAWRRALTRPAYSLFAVATVALGVSLVTASFTVVERVLLSPLPYPDEDELVVLMSGARDGTTFPQVSSTSWHDWTTGTSLASRAALHRPQAVSMSLPEGPARIAVHQVSPEFFDVVRSEFVRGRMLGPTDADQPVVVVGEAFWRDRLGSPDLPADLRVVGRSFEVVGVVADGAGYPQGAEVWTATAPRILPQVGARNFINWGAVARLPPGVSRDGLKGELDRVAARVRAEDPSALYSWQVGVEPLRSFLVGDQTQEIWLLSGATAAVWLLAWLNLAGLSLARTEGRSREVAVRLALGAERRRIVRQIFTEHALTGVVGALGGAALATALMVALEPFFSEALPVDASVRVGWVAISFGLGLGLVTGLLAGIVPAFRAGRMGRRGGGSMGSRLRSRGGRDRLGAALVAAEVALALTLLVGGALLVQSFQSLVGRDLGFDATDVWMASIPLDLGEYNVEFGVDTGPGVEARRSFWDGLMTRLDGDPRVISAGAALGAPTVGGGTGFIEVEGLDEAEIGAGYRAVTGDYFDALGIQRVQGRVFDSSDGPHSGRVVVINESMAARYWPGESALGRRVRAVSMESGLEGTEADWLEVVGVVADMRTYGFDSESAAEMFVLAEQMPRTMATMTLVVRGRPAARREMAGLLRDAVGDLDSRIPVEVEALERRVQNQVASRRALTSFVVAFGTLALLLACVGLYGLLAYVVARRTREIGIRAALGARRARIVRLVIGQSVWVAGLGVVIGGAASLLVGRALRSQLVDISPTHPAAFLLGSALLLLSAAVAALVPALRASRIDPLGALRADDE